MVVIKGILLAILGILAFSVCGSLAFFERDSEETKFVEGIPFIGYVASVVHARAGNRDHARRAAAKSTNSLLKATGAIVGGVVGGPAGAIVGRAAMSSVGVRVEYAIAERIEDESVRCTVGAVKPKVFLHDMVFSAIDGGIGNFGSSLVKKGSVKKFLAEQATRVVVAKVSKIAVY
ncbi:hypothetical protein BC938DRAFT_481114 [Jimgerdemannia flammicorona]|uniref:Uncharacterized protein n=1 Tax=Jimgerdemannia flammicorona TaxID=994334 RepID=A0A433R0J2_9FUNG|nr:hypothetical protein BC938DRAFT_481114 [Jimgerdemannia flammicorona]